ncbi:GntR family transcriptional regulator [Actinomadura bangladeshensis]|uniref:GntR family transcriptional regulator n=1 Tax=Actinomadura bangladeshensis TaxID=453573 RepID=A0A6L9QC04_9ACTN|nr:GntR family transcriptional regulator [Actinomadura bangladeshensis]NEA22193.1 GntR family transcriptional regulator [Actinomadura bangladeshensis]
MSVDMEYAPPKYAQIVQALRRRIANGTYPPGSALPSESRLVKEFGVSRPTVVRALQAMQLRGEIEREHGRGSFVKAAPLPTGGDRARRARTVLDQSEAESSVDVIDVGPAKAPPHVAQLLGLADGVTALRRQYLDRQDDTPCELVTVWVPQDIGRAAGLDQAEALNAPLRRLVQAGAGARLAQVVERLSARRPTSAESNLLGIGKTAPVLGVLASVHDSDGRAVLVVDLALPGELQDLEDTYTL